MLRNSRTYIIFGLKFLNQDYSMHIFYNGKRTKKCKTVTEVPGNQLVCCKRPSFCPWQTQPIGRTKLWCEFPVDHSGDPGERQNIGKRTDGPRKSYFSYFYPNSRWI